MVTERKKRYRPRELGILETKQHGEYVAESTGAGVRVRNKTPDPLSYYFNKGCINIRQEEAGVIYMELFHTAGLTPRLIMKYGSRSNYEGVKKASAENAEAFRIDALASFRSATLAIANRVGRNLLIDVVCFGRLVKDCVGEYQYYSSGQMLMPVLKEGLDDLSRHFGLPKYQDEK